jgi:hypothetical protein
MLRPDFSICSHSKRENKNTPKIKNKKETNKKRRKDKHYGKKYYVSS